MPRGWFTREQYHADDDGQPQGGGVGEGGSKPSDVMERYGRDPLKLAEKLAEALEDNYRLREQRRTLKAEKADLEKRVAPYDARVLTADEATAYDAYLALGAPDALKQSLAGAQQASADLARLRRTEAVRAAAEATGYKATVLTTLAGDLDIQTKADANGKAVAMVVADGKETPLADYAAQQWADFLPALAAKTGSGAPDINAGARGNGNGPAITDEERQAAQRRYSATF